MKIWRIIKSRFESEVEEDFVKQRLAICRDCPENTANIKVLSNRIKIIRFFSKILDIITLYKGDTTNACNQCGCPLHLKAKSTDEVEDCALDKWAHIYIPNSSGAINGKK